MDKIPAIYKSWEKRLQQQLKSLLFWLQYELNFKKKNLNQPYYFDWCTKNYQVSNILIILLKIQGSYDEHPNPWWTSKPTQTIKVQIL